MIPWSERLSVTRYATVEKHRLAWVSRYRQEDAYDGGHEQLDAWWARELARGEFVLHATLADLLASFEPAELTRAIRARPLGFARALARAHELGRVMTRNWLYAALIPEGFEIQPPTVLGEELLFQTFVGVDLHAPQNPCRLWSIRAALGALTPRRTLLRTFRPTRGPRGA
jgi:hypothetical protein